MNMRIFMIILMSFVLSVVSQNREIIGTRVTLEPCQRAILSSEVTSKIVMLKIKEGKSSAMD